MRFFYNTFCYNFMGMVVQLGFCMIVLLCLMVGGMFTGCIFAQRIATVKRLHTIHEKVQMPEESVHSEVFEKKEKSESDSSSSSDED